MKSYKNSEMDDQNNPYIIYAKFIYLYIDTTLLEGFLDLHSRGTRCG